MAEFSNTSTGDAPADPYKKANLDTEATMDTKMETLTAFMKKCKFGMMTTRDPTTSCLVSRCMALAATENGGIDLLFHTNTESGKTNELASDPHVNMSFLDAVGEWASVSGVAEVVTDRSLVKKHYDPLLKAWMGDLGDGTHDGSENDPRIGIIRIKTTTVTYSVSSTGTFGFAKELAKGAMSGKPAQVAKLREVRRDEVETWRAGHLGA